jgi:phage shock protein PspC (stress-responsive transcriptional regulator)
MKKNFTVNICGSIFNIDEDAFDKLNHYLEGIKEHFKNAEGGDEIVSDIESRISEMLREKLSEEKEVITIEDIEKVIQLMGQPFEFEDDDDNGKKEQDGSGSGKRPKRLFRDDENRIIGGVAAGMGAYFNTDPLWFRLGFIGSIFFTGPLLYILFWIIMPLARTTADKLEMRGQKVNVSNIKKSINEEINALKSKLDDLKGETKRTAQRTAENHRNTFDQILEFFIVLVKYCVKAIVVLLGIALVALGIFIAISFFVSILETDSFVHISPIGISSLSITMFLKSIFASSNALVLAIIGIVLLIGIPVLMLIYAGIKLIFNIKFKSRFIGIPALALWIAGILICVVISAHLGRSFSQRVISKKEYKLEQPAGNTLYVNLKKDEGTDEFIEYGSEFMFDRWNMVSLKNQFIGIPRLKFVRSDTDSFQLTLYNTSRGTDYHTAKKRSENIIYSFSQEDTTLLLNPYFSVPNGELWRSQKVKIIIKVPEGKRVKLGEDASMFFDYNFNDEYIYQSSYINHDIYEKEREILTIENEPGEHDFNIRKIRSISGIHLTTSCSHFF